MGLTLPVHRGSPASTGLRIQAFGDSRAAQMAQNSTLLNATTTSLQTSLPHYSAIAWANRLLHGRLNFDLSQGYNGANQGILKIIVVNPGNNYTSPTITLSGSGHNTVLGTPVLNGQGGFISIPVTTQGDSWTSLPVITITDPTGSGAVLLGVVGGYGTLGVNGETTTQSLQRLQSDPSILSLPIDVIVICTGTNDLVNGVAAATTKASLKSIFELWMNAGKYVIYIPDHPRSAWIGITGTAITNARRQMYDVIRWARGYAKGEPAKNPGGYGRITTLDVLSEMADATSATADPLANWTSDGLHYSAISAYALGYKLAQILAPLTGSGLAASSNPRISSQADVYDAVYNPSGALNTNSLLIGTAGSLNNAGGIITGTVPSNYWFGRNNGTATGSVVLSAETSRTDGYSGQRFVATYTLGSGSTTENYQLLVGGVSKQTLSSISVIAGADALRFTADLELSGHQNVNYLALEIDFYDVSNVFLQSTLDGQSQGMALPTATQTMGFVPVISTAIPLTFSTPPSLVPATATQFQARVTIGFNASGAAGSATAVLKIANVVLHKVI